MMMLGFSFKSNWNDENNKRFDAIEAKISNQITLQNGQIHLLQSKLSDKEKVITVLKNKVDQLEERNSKTNVEISDGDNKLRNEIKKLFCLVNDMGQKKDEQEKEVLKLKAENEEIIELLHSVSYFIQTSDYYLLFRKEHCFTAFTVRSPLFPL